MDNAYSSESLVRKVSPPSTSGQRRRASAAKASVDHSRRPCLVGRRCASTGGGNSLYCTNKIMNKKTESLKYGSLFFYTKNFPFPFLIKFSLSICSRFFCTTSLSYPRVLIISFSVLGFSKINFNICERFSRFDPLKGDCFT